jgi:segregation and condensation protein B
MPPSNLQPAIEALLFSSDQPLSLSLLAEAVDSAPDAIEATLRALGESYASRGAGVELREIAGGWMLVTTAEQSEWVGRMLRGKRKMRLSRAGLETLAIIAYKQPVTKSEVEAIRGVDSSGVLATLLERNLVTIRGRSKVVGRPLLYGTTGEFLEHFGLNDLSELPRPEELRALVAAREPEQLDMMELEVVSQVATDLAAGEASGLFRTEHHVIEPLDAASEHDGPDDDEEEADEDDVDEDEFDDDDEFGDDEDGDEDEDEDDEDVEAEDEDAVTADHDRGRS